MMSSVRRPHGRLFQIHGPAAPKLLSPKLLCVRGTAHMLSKEDQRDRQVGSDFLWVGLGWVIQMWSAYNTVIAPEAGTWDCVLVFQGKKAWSTLAYEHETSAVSGVPWV